MATTILPLYWNLSSVNTAERIDASTKLVAALEQFQDQIVAKSCEHSALVAEDEKSEDDHTRMLESLNAVDVAYAVRRLVRGLASPRDNSRLGFAVVLTEILSRLDTVTCSQILSLLKSSSQVSSSMSGQEERENLFARLFGLKSIIQSGLLTRQFPLRSSSIIPSSLESFEGVLAELLVLGGKKNWLRESSWWALLHAIDAVHNSDVPWKASAIDQVIDRVFVSDRSWTPEKVALLLQLQRRCPERAWESLCQPQFKSGDILSTTNLAALGRILKESSKESSEDADVKVNTASWKPQLHFVWDVILDSTLAPGGTGTFQDFYRIVVDETLFAASSSIERKYTGFQVFQKALHRLPSSSLPLLFTQNFMRTWINHLTKADRYLHKLARQVATDVEGVVCKSPTTGFNLVLQLTGTDGSRYFDRVTRTKTVENILSNMNASGIREYLQHLLGQINGGGTEDDGIASVDARRTWIVDQIAAILRNNAVPKDDDVIAQALDFLVTHGFCNIVKKSSKSLNIALHCMPTPPFSDRLSKTCRTRLLGCLAELTDRSITVSKDGEVKARLSGASSSGELWVCKALNTLSALAKDRKHVNAIIPFSDDARAALDDSYELSDNLAKFEESQAKLARGTQILISGLVLLNLSQAEDDADWDSLRSCLDAAQSLLVAKKSSQKNRELSVETPIDVLVDAIIGLLEEGSAFRRTVAHQAFRLLTPAVSESTVDLILAQLERRDPAQERKDEEMDASENGAASGADVDSSQSSDGETPDDSDDYDDDNNENDSDDAEDGDAADLREKLKKILPLAAEDDDEESSFGSSDDDSDLASMDDEQMMQIDEQLAAVFRAKAEGHSKGKDKNAQREATYFKNRVLDLIEIYMKEQPGNELVFRMILPIVDLIAGASPDERQLSDKANGVLRSCLSKPKGSPAITDAASIGNELESLHQRARKVRSSDLLSSISVCSLFISKALVAIAEDVTVVKVYNDSLIDFASRKASALNPGFFLDFIRHHIETAWALRPTILDATSNSVNGYRQSQVFGFAQALLTALPAPDSRKDEVDAFMRNLSKALRQAVSESCKADKPMLSTAQMKELLKIGTQLCRYSRRVTPETVARSWTADAWKQLGEELGSSDHFKFAASLQGLCRQISQLAQPSVSKKKADKMVSSPSEGTKRKLDDGTGLLPGTAKRKKAHKKDENGG